MTDREKLIEVHENIRKPYDGIFTPAIPGPTTEDPNIMELCFHNGERYMRDKIKTSLLELSADMPCVTISQVIKIMEDLQ